MSISFFYVPEIGLEPIRILLHWYLKPARLPFRHPGGTFRSHKAVFAVYGCKGRKNFHILRIIPRFFAIFYSTNATSLKA